MACCQVADGLQGGPPAWGGARSYLQNVRQDLGHGEDNKAD